MKKVILSVSLLWIVSLCMAQDHPADDKYIMDMISFLRFGLFSDLPLQQAKIEKTIVYEIGSFQKDEAAKSIITSTGVRKILFNRVFIKNMFKACDAMFINVTFSNKPSFKEYIKVAVSNKDTMAISPIAFARLSREEQQFFDSHEARVIRQNNYTAFMMFILCHETAHHTLPGHLDRKVQSAKEIYDQELAADTWAAELLHTLGNSPLGAISLCTYQYYLNVEAINSNVQLTHPAGFSRVWTFLKQDLYDKEWYHKNWETQSGGSSIAYDSLLMLGRWTYLQLLNDQTLPKEVIEEKAALGDPEAQLKTGYMYLLGIDGWEEDSTKALFWLTKAANNEQDFAQYILAMTNEAYGHLDEAIKWYRKAANNKNIFAKLLLEDLEKRPYKSKLNYGQEIYTCAKLTYIACLQSCINRKKKTIKECKTDECLVDFVGMESYLYECRKIIFNTK